jgi:hypothetical protein
LVGEQVILGHGLKYLPSGQQGPGNPAVRQPSETRVRASPSFASLLHP